MKFMLLLCSRIFGGVRLESCVRKTLGVVERAPSEALAHLSSIAVKFLMKYVGGLNGSHAATP